MNRENHFKNRLSVIKERFITDLSNHLPLIETVQEQANSGLLKQEDMVAACMYMHKVAGSAKIFGLGELNDRAAHAEELLNRLLDTQLTSTSNHELLLALLSFIEEANNCIAS